MEKMTRLREEWIRSPENDLTKCNDKLKKTIGCDISELAFFAAGAEPMPKEAMKNHKAAVVRFTAGKGIIGSFAESAAEVIRYMGVDAIIPKATDAAGIYEGITKGADILFMADDNRFIAFNIKTGKGAENDIATAKGYVAALSKGAGGLSGKETLLLGHGRLGKTAAEILRVEGAIVDVYDKSSEKTLPLPLSGLVFDATNEGGWLGARDITKDALIAAPGIPLSLDDEAYLVHENRVLHDKLQTGTAVMLAMVTAK